MNTADFNPRPLAGATDGAQLAYDVLWISIHAPLRGRHRQLCLYRHCHDFNPRPLAGATILKDKYNADDSFQSTPPCGGDHKARANAVLRVYFNPRPLAGATLLKHLSWSISLISIHAPLRGRLPHRQHTRCRW